MSRVNAVRLVLTLILTHIYAQLSAIKCKTAHLKTGIADIRQAIFYLGFVDVCAQRESIERHLEINPYLTELQPLNTNQPVHRL